MAWMLPAVSAGASVLGGLFNRPRDPMSDFMRTGFLTYGQNDPLGFANSAFARFLGSPAYQGMQRGLFGQSQGFSNQLQSSLAQRGLLNSGLGNVIGSLGSNLYGGNLANLQGQQYQGFADLFPQLLQQRMQLSQMTPQRPSFLQGLGAGLQGLGGFGLNYMALGGQNPFGGGMAAPTGPRMGQAGFQYPLGR